MQYKIYYLRDLSGLFDKHLKKMELDEIQFHDRENLFSSVEEAQQYLFLMKEVIANNTFTVLPYIKI